MRTCFLAFCLLPVFYFEAQAQLCAGSLGDPVVNITFGAGTNPGPPLNAATTNLKYTSDACAVNGFYTVLHSMVECNYGWHVLQNDHTGNPNGYFMLIDASFDPNDFYLDTVKGLCANTTYEFGAWILNLKKISDGIRPDIKFTIETVTGQVLQTYNTGDVPPESVPKWRQYGFFFTTTAATGNIVLRMANKAPGGDGNDLALDDITFRPCGPKLSASIIGFNGADNIKVCEADTATFHFISTISAGYTSPAFQWQVSSDNGNSWNDIPGADKVTYHRLSTTAGNYQYRLTVAESTNINITTCRVASNPITVNVLGMPVISVHNNGPKCSGSPTSLAANGALTYNWIGPNGFTANGASVIVNTSQAIEKYYVLATDNSGCKVKDSTTVITYAKPVALFSNSNITCAKTDILFTDLSTVNAGTITNWQWNFGDGSIAINKNQSHAYTVAGAYNISLVVTTDKQCTDTITGIINAHPLPSVNFILPEVCLSDAFASFVDSSFITDNSESSFTYAWDFGDTNASTSNPDNSILKDPRHSYTATGNYPVSLMVTSKDGCSDANTKTFTVNGALPVANFSIISSNNCSNQPVTITNNSTVNFGSVTRLEIYWDYPNNPSNKTIDELPSGGKQYSNQYAIFGTPLTKNVQIKLIAYSGISCVNETSKTFSLLASPQLKFSNMAPVCAGVEPFLLTAAGNINNLSGTGNYSGNAVNGSGEFDPSLATTGMNIIRYSFVATNNCNDFIENNIEVLAQPMVDAGPDRTVLEGGSITLNATASGNHISYTWLPNIAIDNNRIATPKVSPPDDQLYELTVTSGDNCLSTDEVFVKVLKTPVVPNAFSPNGDGINDVWTIRYLDSYPQIDLLVYDRYGQLVYRSRNYNTPWNGTRNNIPLPAGTYYYIIDRKIAAAKLNGSVTIIR